MTTQHLKRVLLLEPFHVPAGFEKTDPTHLIYKGAPFPVDFMTYAAGLIYVKTKFMATRFHSVPLGLAQVSAILKERGVQTSHEPFLLDAAKRELPDAEIERRARGHDYDEAWLSVGSQDEAKEAIRYARILKAIDPAKPVVLGGIFPTFYPAWFMDHPEIDAVFRGPAEDAVRAYVAQHGTATKDIPGYCYKRDGKAIIAASPAPMPDPATLPPMDLEGLCLDAYMKDNPFANVITSRGCPFACPFCSHAAYWGTRVHYRKMDNIRVELRAFQDHGCKAGYMVDSAFTLNEAHVRKFVDAWRAEGFTMKLAFETRADHFGSDMAALCKGFSPALVWFGGESGSPAVMSRLPGKQAGGGTKHLDDLRSGVRNARAAGIMSGSSWVLGLPGETPETVAETERLILELMGLGMDIADVRNLQIFPGTDYYEHAEAWGIEIASGGIRLEKGRWQEAINHRIPTMSSEEIQAATRGVQAAIMARWKDSPEYKRVLRAVGAVQFLARCKKAATSLRRAKDEV